ncbi:MAG TPA: TIGR03435 family protein [Bryobacteraceae bacterium]
MKLVARLAWLALPGALIAQSFEVASIKPNDSGSYHSSSNTNDGGWRAENVSLKQMIEFAYDINDYALSAPDWLDSERFDVQAKSPVPMRGKDFELMLQSLLADRFGLTTHREPKQISGYALVPSKNPPTSHPMPAEAHSSMNFSSNAEGGKMTAKDASMQQVADFFARQLRQPVEDMTGLSGAFDLNLQWTPDDQTRQATGDTPSLFTAVQEQLGLKLRPQKVTVQVLVVDHVERKPTEN